MPYRIQNGETIDQGVRRLLHERVRRARSELAGKFDDAVVHEVRQELKFADKEQSLITEEYQDT